MCSAAFFLFFFLPSSPVRIDEKSACITVQHIAAHRSIKTINSLLLATWTKNHLSIGRTGPPSLKYRSTEGLKLPTSPTDPTTPAHFLVYFWTLYSRGIAQKHYRPVEHVCKIRAGALQLYKMSKNDWKMNRARGYRIDSIHSLFHSLNSDDLDMLFVFSFKSPYYYNRRSSKE